MGQSEGVREPRGVRKACPAFVDLTDIGVTNQAMPKPPETENDPQDWPARKQGPPTKPLSLAAMPPQPRPSIRGQAG